MDDIKDMEDFKLKVMGVNVFPMVKAGMKFQSDAKRREQTVSMSAPDPEGKPVLDWYDCKGENPYTVEEILPDKVWRVGYKMELMQYTRGGIQSCFCFVVTLAVRMKSPLLRGCWRKTGLYS